MIDYKTILSDLFAKIETFKAEKPSAGTRFRLMGIAADVVEVAETMKREVLDVVSHEAVLDADVDIDYAEVAEQVLAMEFAEDATQEPVMAEQRHLANEALSELSRVLTDIDKQLTRHHSEQEYTRLFEGEKRRYTNSGSSGRARQKFEEWKEIMCADVLTMDEIEDYRMSKVLKMFGKGVFNTRVEQIQRAKRYPGELDFEQLEGELKISKTIYHHYAALRKLVDWKDGMLVMNPARIGQHFYASRHEENAKQNRSSFLNYMYKITLAQEERARLVEAQAEALRQEEEAAGLNLFAPTKRLKGLLAEEWFSIHSTHERYDEAWTVSFVDALMTSEYKNVIATEWGKKNRQDYIRGCIVGLLKEGGVLKGSMDSIARSTGICENYRTFSKYMGQSTQEPYAGWVLNYIRESAREG